MKIKICGITRLEDAQLCVKYGVDAIGFIFYSKSKRYITPDSAFSISKMLPLFLHRIGVFVNENIDDVNNIAKLVKLTAVQLHGNESPEYISKINYPVIKSFGVDEAFDFSELNNYSNCGILLDVKDTEQHGGTGNSFNWEIIPKEFRNRIILAGGIGIDNIEFIADNIKPYAVDVSSSVESEAGVKDKGKIIELLNVTNKIKQTKYEEK
jgi:phosphoribosylanthranilate isomerase